MIIKDLSDLFEASLENRKLFIDTVFHDRIKINNKLESQKLYFLMISSGYQVKIENGHIVTGKGDNLAKVKLLSPEDPGNSRNQEVYDLETEDGTFQAGVGQLIVHNTDSIFIKPKIDLKLSHRDRLIQTIEFGIKVGREITEQIGKYPHDLEYEKTFYPYLLFDKKKNYEGHLYEKDPDKFKVKSMGGVSVKRDVPPVTKNIYRKIVDLLLERKDIGNVVQILTDYLDNMFKGNLPSSDFVITKSLRDSSYYKDPKSIQHRVLADRMAERDPGSALQSNQRIEFIHIEKFSKDRIVGESIETPEFIEKHGLRINYLYYLEKLMIKSLSSVLDLIVQDSSELFKPFVEVERKRRDIREKMDIAEKQHLRKITDFFTVKTVKLEKKKKIQVTYKEKKEKKKEKNMDDFFDKN